MSNEQSNAPVETIQGELLIDKLPSRPRQNKLVVWLPHIATWVLMSVLLVLLVYLAVTSTPSGEGDENLRGPVSALGTRVDEMAHSLTSQPPAGGSGNQTPIATTLPQVQLATIELQSNSPEPLVQNQLVQVTISLKDRVGNPWTTATTITVVASGGLVGNDENPASSTVDVFVENGQEMVRFKPTQSGMVTLNARGEGISAMPLTLTVNELDAGITGLMISGVPESVRPGDTFPITINIEAQSPSLANGKTVTLSSNPSQIIFDNATPTLNNEGVATAQVIIPNELAFMAGDHPITIQASVTNTNGQQGPSDSSQAMLHVCRLRDSFRYQIKADHTGRVLRETGGDESPGVDGNIGIIALSPSTILYSDDLIDLANVTEPFQKPFRIYVWILHEHYNPTSLDPPQLAENIAGETGFFFDPTSPYAGTSSKASFHAYANSYPVDSICTNPENTHVLIEIPGDLVVKEGTDVYIESVP